MRHRLLGAVALVLVLVVGGCSDDDEPDVADPTFKPTTSEPTRSDPTSEPPSSTAAAQPEPESAENFIRRWYQVSDRMQNTGDASKYRSLGPQCRGCNQTADLIEGYYDAGGYVRFGGTRIVSIKSSGQAESNYEFEVNIESESTRYKEAAGAAPQSFEGGRNRIRLRIKRQAASWVVVEYTALTS